MFAFQQILPRRKPRSRGFAVRRCDAPYGRSSALLRFTKYPCALVTPHGVEESSAGRSSATMPCPTDDRLTDIRPLALILHLKRVRHLFSVIQCRRSCVAQTFPLMLLGLPPDMVRGVLSHRTRTA